MTGIEMCQQIVDWEARRDAEGRIILWDIPKGDGGGRYEYAGINDRYHPKALLRIRDLVQSEKHKEAEDYAVHYVEAYTTVASSWSLNDGVDFFLRDCCFNRGAGGAAKILQTAIDTSPDGDVGKITLAALRKAEKRPFNLLLRLHAAREVYERALVGVRSEFWAGLRNRWDNAYFAALKIT